MVPHSSLTVSPDSMGRNVHVHRVGVVGEVHAAKSSEEDSFAIETSFKEWD
jgi:hypothetical protein